MVSVVSSSLHMCVRFFSGETVHGVEHLPAGTSNMKFPCVRVLLLGLSGVGKSSIIRRYLGDGGYTPENHVVHRSHMDDNPIDSVVTCIKRINEQDTRTKFIRPFRLLLLSWTLPCDVDGNGRIMALDPVVPEIAGLDEVECISRVAEEQFRKHEPHMVLLVRHCHIATFIRFL